MMVDMFQASPVPLRAAESLKARLVSTLLAGLAVAFAFAAIATSLHVGPQARVLALGVYSVFGTGAGFACFAIRRLLRPTPVTADGLAWAAVGPAQRVRAPGSTPAAAVAAAALPQTTVVAGAAEAKDRIAEVESA